MFGEDLVVRICTWEDLDWYASLGFSWDMISDVSSKSNGIGPKVDVDSLGPSVGSMQQHGSCMFSDISDPTLSYTILVMGTNSTESDGLSRSFDLVHESSLSKSSIVSMVMLNGHSHVSSIGLKCGFCFQSFICSSPFRYMDICQTWGMISKDCSSLVPFLS